MSNRLLEDFSEIASDWFWEMDADLRFSYFSGPFEKIVGVPADHWIGKSRLDVAVNAGDSAFWQQHVDDLLARRPFRDFIYPFRRPDGQTLWFRISGQPVFDEDGAFLGYRGVGTDISAEYEARQRLAQALDDLHRSHAELEAQNLRFDLAVNHMSQGLCMFDADHRLIICNWRYAELYGLTPELTEPGTPLKDILAHRLASREIVENPEKFVNQMLFTIDEGEPAELIVEMCDGRNISVKHQPMPGGGWVSTHEDITERKRAEDRIAHLARHDSLTGLPNRLLFRERLEAAVAACGRGRQFAVLILDLDHFKSVNDTLGHPRGDRVLIAVADRLRQCVRETDTVARLGGDELAILQSDISRPDDAGQLALRVIEAIGKPFRLDEQETAIGVSIGIATAPTDGTDPDELLKHADTALYRSKEDGRNICRYFEPAMDARQQARRALERDLRNALTNGEFELVYQPIFALPRRHVIGFESLLRWHHPQRGQLSPDQFIESCEELGIIIPVGEWVLRTACAEAARWPVHLSVAVNLSPVQFRSPTLVQSVMTALAEAQLEPNRLELEITESALLLENESTLRALHRFRELGVRISMDDFGTGYSSLSYLRSFPFDKIKIDRSFVADMESKADSLAIVRAVNGLARNLDIVTLAEGVETEEQLRLLQNDGCDEVQGYLFGAPVPARELPTCHPSAGHAPARLRA